MNTLSPSMEDWRKLFRLALEFKSIKSWEWMEDTVIFGVQSPKTGETCYCVVLGKERSFAGLAIYIGDNGLMSLLDMLELKHGEEEQFYHNDLIMIHFTDRKYLAKDELDIIKKLGLKFRGSNNWVSFRRYLPGYYPCSINKEEAELLVSILKEVTNVCLRFKEGPGLIADNKNLVRVVKEKGKNVLWEDTWVELDYPEEMVSAYDPEKIFGEAINPFALERTSDEWAIDLFFAPTLIDEEDERGTYFPYIGIVWNIRDNTGIGLQTFKYSREERFKYPQELFLNAVESTKSLPKTILVREEDSYEALVDFTRQVGIGIEIPENIEVLGNVRNLFMEYLRY